MSDLSARIFESVPNVSTADPWTVRELAATLARPPAVRLIDVGSDAREGRTVFTVLGEEAPLLDALVALARRCNELLDLRTHEGLHPRVGHLDVVPLVALHPSGTPEDAAGPARRLMQRLVEEAGLRCAPYEAAAASWADLGELRRGGLARLSRRIEAGEVECLRPANSSSEPDLRRGVTLVGARRPLVDLNVELLSGELRVARRLADRLHESTGGLPAVRAAADKLAPDRVRVALSLLDPSRTDVPTAHDWVRRLAEEEGVRLGRAELVGCVPAAAWPTGLGERIDEPQVRGETETRRILESWLPGGRLAGDPGLRPADLPAPEPGKVVEGDSVAKNPKPKLRLLDLALDEAKPALESVLTELGERSYRADQVLVSTWKHRRRSFDEMTELPKRLRAALDERVQVALLEVAERREASDGTVKYLWRCPDGAEVESVSIPTPRRTTFCVSSQVGCSLKCKFCATGYLGFGRNLSAGEILDQVLGMLSDLGLSGESLNVVFMGMGEPGHNLGAVVQAVEWLNDPAGLEVGARRITVSTSGVPAAIARLAEVPIQLRLALSLHAADQALRESLMNIAAKHSLEELRAACQAYHDVTRRAVTLEYCLIPGVTDGPANARQLAAWAAGFPSKVNLIPYNPVEEFRTEPATPEICQRFRTAVLAAGYQGDVTVRETRGRDIEAACGMLHRHRGGSVGAAGE